jgi:hypothetical protein
VEVSGFALGLLVKLALLVLTTALAVKRCSAKAPAVLHNGVMLQQMVPIEALWYLLKLAPGPNQAVLAESVSTLPEVVVAVKEKEAMAQRVVLVDVQEELQLKLLKRVL